jgi:hypothetical protein
MYIDKELFDECWCPCEGIGRVCLRGDKGIPEELEQMAREIDGDNYMESCFSIDVFNGGAMINYMAEHNFHELCKCDNHEEVLEYYKAHASKQDLKETCKSW